MKSVQRYICLLLLLGYTLFAQAQLDSVKLEDKLQNQLTTAQGTAKADILNALGKHYLTFYLDAKKGLFYSEQALALSQKLSYAKGQVRSLISIGSSYIFLQDYKLTRSYLEEAVRLAKESKDMEGVMLYLNGMIALHRSQAHYKEALQYGSQALSLSRQLKNRSLYAGAKFELGRTYLQQANYPKAVECFLEAAKAAEEAGNYTVKMFSSTNLGIIYENSKEFDKALFYHLEALKVHKQFAKGASIMSLVNIGEAYYKRGNYSKALEYTQEAYREAVKEKHSLAIAFCLGNMGHSYVKLKNYKEALSHFTQAMTMHQDVGFDEGVIDIANGFSDLYLTLKQYPKAIRYGQQALHLARKTEIRHQQLQAYSNLSKAYAGMADFSNAYSYHIQLMGLKDSLFNEESKNEIRTLQSNYDLEKKQNQINLLAKEKQLQQAELSKQRFLRNSLLIGLLLCLIFGVGLLFINKSLRRKNERIIRQSLKIDFQKKELEYKNSKLLKLNEEKSFLVDMVAHDLKGPLLNLQRLTEVIMEEEDDQADKALSATQHRSLELMGKTTKRLLETVRDVLEVQAVEKHPADLELREVHPFFILKSAINEHQVAAQAKGITLVPDLRDEKATVTADPIYLHAIIDNLLSNAIKFSMPGTVVALRQFLASEQKLQIEVVDQGPGISESDQMQMFTRFRRLSAQPTGGESSSGLGLFIVKQLVESMEANIYCRSTLGEGTTFVVEFLANTTNGAVERSVPLSNSNIEEVAV